MLSDLMKRFLDWLFQAENRSLLFAWLPIVIVGAVYLFAITASNSLSAWLQPRLVMWQTLAAWGALFVALGFAHGVIYGTKRDLVLGAFPLILCGLAVVIGGYVSRPVLPTDRFVVAICPFEPATKSLEEEAIDCSLQLRDMLSSDSTMESWLAVKYLKNSAIQGRDVEEYQQSAYDVCRHLPAHMTLWGEIWPRKRQPVVRLGVAFNPNVFPRRTFQHGKPEPRSGGPGYIVFQGNPFDDLPQVQTIHSALIEIISETARKAGVNVPLNKGSR